MKCSFETLLFFAGLGLAGAEGAWFPWVNLAGVLMFLSFAVLVRRQPEEEKNEEKL